MKTIVIGASSGLGRCIGVGLAQRGAQVALMARRKERIEEAAEEAGSNAIALECDVTDATSCQAAIEEAASRLDGIDGLLYAPGIGPLVRLVDTDAKTWARVFETNVTGAALATAAAIPHLKERAGTAVYLSSVAASMSPPWPGLGSYAVSKAALDKLVEAFRSEHPDLAFTRVVVGDCGGGQGDAMTEFNRDWDRDLLMKVAPSWVERRYISGSQFEVDDLVNVVETILRGGATVSVPTVTLVPRTPPGPWE